ncbi:hypothetical protein GOP47_0022363 [Adiantum capillus-veneris]|uniref:Uncharacterized protein n=1 Tax=Adiantum capillus-veneris TaxID=13818 RepID=A0A9D4Z5A0_ADICA|nr:hypothetical protein GOP47_0022363 [Adiantum capillus-veneris]
MADLSKKNLKLAGHDSNPEAEALTIAVSAPLANKLDVEAEKELSTEAEIQGQRAENEEQAEASEIAPRKRNRGHGLPSTSQDVQIPLVQVRQEVWCNCMGYFRHGLGVHLCIDGGKFWHVSIWEGPR